MAKKNVVARPLQKVVRVGDKIDYRFEVSDYGTDNHGPFAILNVLSTPQDAANPDDRPIAGRCKAIDSFKENITLGDWDDEVFPLADEMAAAEAVAISEAIIPAEAVDVTQAEKFRAEKAAEQEKKFAELEAKAAKLKFKEPLPPITVCEVLNIRLTDDERATAAKNASNLLGELEDAEETLKALNNERKAKIKGLKEQVKRAKEAHNTGLEFRSVHCEQRFDVEAGMTWFVFRGEDYGRRPMNEKEERETRQKSLFKDAPMLPNRVTDEDIAKKPRTSEEMAQAATGGDCPITPVKPKRGRPRKEDVLPNGQSTDPDIRDVMNAETSRKGGKRDHVST